MKGENRTNQRNSSKNLENDKTEQTLITNLPLLFANGKPVSLEKITLPELEEFVPFMVKCSLGRGVSGNRDLNACATPEWWPKEEIPFKFPIRGPSPRQQKLNALKSLVCRCYTYYDCEFLLKFSTQLSLMPSENLRYVRNEDNETTCIYSKTGMLLVKFRNENMMYDVGKHARRHLYPIIDSPYYTIKRIGDSRGSSGEADPSEETGCGLHKKKKKKRSQRIDKDRDLDLFQDQSEPTVLNQNEFLNLFNLVSKEPTATKDEPLRTQTKTRLGKRFVMLPFSSHRGREIIANARYTVNAQHHIDRIERHISADSSTQICTRMTMTSNVDDLDGENSGLEEGIDRVNGTFTHNYKWPKRCHNPKRMHRGPSLKECYVKCERLSEDIIRSSMRSRRISAGTMTPEEWRDESAFCDCAIIPGITLTDDKDSCKTSDKSCSTRCNCKTGNDIRSTQNNPHNLKNIASHFGNSNISNNNNNNNSNGYKTNDSHTKKHYSSTNQRNSLGRTRTNGPVLTEFPNFSFTSSDALGKPLSVPAKSIPYIPLQGNCDLPKVKICKTRNSKQAFVSSLETIVPDTNTTNDIETGPTILSVTSRNCSITLRKRSIPGQWEILNNRNLKSNAKTSRFFNIEPLQENLIPNNMRLVTKKRKIVTSELSKT